MSLLFFGVAAIALIADRPGVAVFALVLMAFAR
jgi:hypothetical protein